MIAKKILTKTGRNFFEYVLCEHYTYNDGEPAESRASIGRIFCKNGQWHIDIEYCPPYWNGHAVWDHKVDSFAMGYKILTKGIEIIEQESLEAAK